MTVPQEKHDICHRPQITPQGIYLHHGFEILKMVPHQITNIFLRKHRKQKTRMCNHFRRDGMRPRDLHCCGRDPRLSDGNRDSSNVRGGLSGLNSDARVVSSISSLA